jgi:hypothetical protein
VENERHQVGIKRFPMCLNWQVGTLIFWEPDYRQKTLFVSMNSVKPQALALSIALAFNMPTLERMLQTIRQHFPTLPVLVGGQAFRMGGHERLATYSHVTYLADLYALEALLAHQKPFS